MPFRNEMMVTMPAKIAKQRGMKQYFTGIPCIKYGHIGMRYTSSGCVGCAEKKYELNSKAMKARATRWKKSNPETVKAIAKACYDRTDPKIKSSADIHEMILNLRKNHKEWKDEKSDE